MYKDILNKIRNFNKKYFILILISFLYLITFFSILIKLFDISNFGISIASIAASMFLIYTKSSFGKLKNIIGGYGLGALSSILILKLNYSLEIQCAIAALITIFFMLIFKVAHASGVSMAISFVLENYNILTIIYITVGIYVLMFITLTHDKILQKRNILNINHIRNKDNKIKFNFQKREKAKVLFVKHPEYYE